jgi:hypothetical protein
MAAKESVCFILLPPFFCLFFLRPNTQLSSERSEPGAAGGYRDFVCCDREMTPTGFQSGNGWECEVCGHRELDVASFKLGGNYEEYLAMSADK